MSQPMQVTIALSVEQQEEYGIPEWMTEDEVAECLDTALLCGTTLKDEVEDFIYQRDTEVLLNNSR